MSRNGEVGRRSRISSEVSGQIFPDGSRILLVKVRGTILLRGMAKLIPMLLNLLPMSEIGLLGIKSVLSSAESGRLFQDGLQAPLVVEHGKLLFHGTEVLILKSDILLEKFRNGKAGEKFLSSLVGSGRPLQDGSQRHLVVELGMISLLGTEISMKAPGSLSAKYNPGLLGIK